MTHLSTSHRAQFRSVHSRQHRVATTIHPRRCIIQLKITMYQTSPHIYNRGLPQVWYTTHAPSYSRKASREYRRPGSKAWIANARATDDRLSIHLGTLNHLPLEIRQLIYNQVLYSHIMNHPFEHDLKYWAFDTRYENRGLTTYRYLWYEEHSEARERSWLPCDYLIPYYPRNLASFLQCSPTTLEEFHSWFFRSHEILFQCPLSYHMVMNTFSPKIKGELRRLRIEVMTKRRLPLHPPWEPQFTQREWDEAWKDIFEELPSRIEVVIMVLDLTWRLLPPKEKRTCLLPPEEKRTCLLPPEEKRT